MMDESQIIAPEKTVRIEHDRKRLLFATFGSGMSASFALVYLIWRITHPSFIAPWWALTMLAVVALTAVINMLRNLYRLQDADPALVISPLALKFKPAVFGEMVSIPWTAIKSLRSKRRKQFRYLVLQVNDVDRYMPRMSFFSNRNLLLGTRAHENVVVFGAPISKSAWKELDALLQRYLTYYGKPEIVAASISKRTPTANSTPTSNQKIDRKQNILEHHLQ
jgi:hypothetical protein